MYGPVVRSKTVETQLVYSSSATLTYLCFPQFYYSMLLNVLLYTILQSKEILEGNLILF